MSSTKELRTAIRVIAAKAEWTSLTDLRAKFGAAISREAIDQALVELHAARQIHLMPEATGWRRRELEAGALYLGGELRHHIRLR